MIIAIETHNITVAGLEMLKKEATDLKRVADFFIAHIVFSSEIERVARHCLTVQPIYLKADENDRGIINKFLGKGYAKCD